MREILRSIPAVDKCLKALSKDADLARFPQKVLKDFLNSYQNQLRDAIRNGKCRETIDFASHIRQLKNFIIDSLEPALRPVLNGAGVIVHTNLGRSLLSQAACKAVAMAASQYCNLEMDLETGERGSRHAVTNRLICKLSGAEASLVVNNNAAAVLLMLDSLCSGGETIVSRGELVEIGGSFRIPDIMLKSGSILKEVGTTNRTHPEDYLQAINDNTKALMRVHASNFRIIGFHSSVDLKELRKIASEHGLLLLVDLGSGNLLDFSEAGLQHEPTVKDVIAAGADLVCFSGDKALGGPQAGIIAGKANLVEKLKKNPLTRALRCDKLCLAALEATLRLYLDPEQARNLVPTAAMIFRKPEELAHTAGILAKAIQEALKAADIDCKVETRKDESRVGGGSFPEQRLSTTLVCLYPQGISVQQLRANLLKGEVPLIGRLENDAFCIDPRTLKKEDFPTLLKSFVDALS